MIHFTCDLCRREMNPEGDLRYIVKMEIYSAMDPLEDDEVDSDHEPPQEIHEIIERMDDAESEEIGDDIYQQLRFDLCPQCRKRFIKNPLGRQLIGQFEFSKN